MNLFFKNLAMYIIPILLLLATTQACLDPSQPITNCSSCQGGQVLVNSMCFQRIRGCLQYTSHNSNQIICSECQYGYVKFGDGCEREAVVKSMTQGTIDNSPAPLVASNLGKLNASTVEKSNTSYKVQASKEEKIEEFPEIEIQEKETQKDENVKQIEKWLLEQGKEDMESPLIVINKYQSENVGQQYFEAILADGTQILLSKLENEIHLKGIQRKTQKVYELLKQQPIITQIHFQQCNSFILSTNLANYSVIIDQFQHKWSFKEETLLAGIPSRNLLQINQIDSILSKPQNEKKKELRDKFKVVYQKFKQEVSIVNIPEQIASIKLSKKDEDKQVWIFRISFQTEANAREQAIFQFDNRNQQIKVQGYFLDGQNVFEEAKRIRESLNTQKQEQKSFKKIEAKDDTNEINRSINITQATKIVNESESIKKIIGDNFKVTKIQPQISGINICQIISENGSFEMKLLKQVDGKISQVLIPGFISAAVQTSGRSCQNMEPDSELQKIIQYLLSKYTILRRFPDKNIQEKLQKNNTVFRIMFFNDQFEQIEVIVEKSMNSNPKYSLKKIEFLNQGTKLTQNLNRVLFSSMLTQKNKLTQQGSVFTGLGNKYRKYLKDATIQAVFQNKAHYKAYLQTSTYVMEAIIQKQNPNNCLLKAIQRKSPDQTQALIHELGLPPEYSPQKSLSYLRNPQLYSSLVKIESHVRNKYGYYLDREFEGCFFVDISDDSDSNLLYKMVCKSQFGLYEVELEVDRESFDEIKMGAIKSIPKWPKHNLEYNLCSINEILDETIKSCVKKVENCEKQVGGVCVLCQKSSVMGKDHRECISSCQQTLSSY